MVETYPRPDGPTAAAALNRLGRALADPNRCGILLRLRHGVCYPSDLAVELGLTKANVSNHLACLRGCGLVVVTPEGRRQRYELAGPLLARALDDLVALACQTNPGVCEAEQGVAS